MAFKDVPNKINRMQPVGRVGEFSDYGGNCRVFGAVLNSADETTNILGRVFTVTTPATGTYAATTDPHAPIVQAGGTGAIAGIGVNSGEQSLYGTRLNSLAPSLVIPNGASISICAMGQVWVAVKGAVKVGQQAKYDNKTGEFITTGTATIPTAYYHYFSGIDMGNGYYLAIVRITEPMNGTDSKVPAEPEAQVQNGTENQKDKK